jgi:hypothetical protein
MLLNNYAIRNANQNRSLGGNVDPTYNMSPSKMRSFYINESAVAEVIGRMSLVEEGVRPPYALVLAPTEGGTASLYLSAGVATAGATALAGLFETATSDGVATATGTGGLVVELEGTSAGVATVTGDITGALESVGTSDGVATVTADIGADAALEGTATGSATVSGLTTGLGLTEGVIYVNESQATVDQIVEEVVQAIIDMGATGGLTVEEHAQLMKTLTTVKFLGLK